MTNAIRVHRNLHNAKRGGPQWVRTHRGKVAEYLDSVALSDVSTRVQAGGVKRAQAAQVRNVCAYLDGTPDPVHPHALPPGETPFDGGLWFKVTFDPRTDDSFGYRPVSDGAIVYSWNRARRVILLPTGEAWVSDPTWED